ncbi:hypothetical protein H2248_008926 [Termitomyces sp. 'cryptogamus']|nr:hypothetical protein H2248_008926 [Termitomyces sp. 'cryptogamus']
MCIYVRSGGIDSDGWMDGWMDLWFVVGVGVVEYVGLGCEVFGCELVHRCRHALILTGKKNERSLPPANVEDGVVLDFKSSAPSVYPEEGYYYIGLVEILFEGAEMLLTVFLHTV